MRWVHALLTFVLLPACDWFGSSSHPVTVIDAGVGYCYGEFSPCNQQSGEGECLDQAGCTYVAAHCEGPVGPCEQFMNQGECEIQLGCVFHPENDTCTGTPTPCEGLDGIPCADQEGCLWVFGECAGTALACDALSDEASCESQRICDWYDPGESPPDAEVPLPDATVPPDASPPDARILADSGPGSCTGEYSACNQQSGMFECTHQAGCTYIPAHCTGTAGPCGQFQNQFQCEAQLGCTFHPADNTCTGTPQACGGLAIIPCADQEGCFWAFEECTGTALACEEITEQSVCETQRICTWQ